MITSYLIKKNENGNILILKEVFHKEHAEDIVITLRASIKPDEQTTIYYTVRIL